MRRRRTTVGRAARAQRVLRATKELGVGGLGILQVVLINILQWGKCSERGKEEDNVNVDNDVHNVSSVVASFQPSRLYTYTILGNRYASMNSPPSAVNLSSCETPTRARTEC